MYIFKTVDPEIARNNDIKRNKKSIQLNAIDESTIVMKYENIPVYSKSIVCLALISSP